MTVLHRSGFARLRERPHAGAQQCVRLGLMTVQILLMTLSASSPAWAHGFGQRFTLPLPFWLYGGGACAALLLSFLVLLRKNPPAQTMNAASQARIPSQGGADDVSSRTDTLQGMPVRIWMGTNALLMLLAIVSGWVGSQHAASNFNMTWFWIIFLLGFFYLAAVAGRQFEILNPWWCATALAKATRNFLPASQKATADTDSQTDNTLLACLSAWPAWAGYMLLIELELFGHASPRSLSIFLAGFTAMYLLVSVRCDSSVWFRQFDTFHALFQHISRLRQVSQPNGLMANISMASQMLICAMLASTAFDALKESVPWATELWKLLLTLYPQNTTNPLSILSALSETYRKAEMLAWLLMPFVYWGLMAVMVAASRLLAPVAHAFSHDMSLASLALLPLVLGYHIAHYFPLLLSEAPNLIHLLSDPLGEQWNLLGTAGMLRAPIMLETDIVWHLQVMLIVAGHLGGVWVSHWQAGQIHSTRAAVVRSQLPMLVWMMALTTWGLWILSQPMKVG